MNRSKAPSQRVKKALFGGVAATGSGSGSQEAPDNITGQKISDEKLRHNASLLSIAGRMGRLGAWAVDLASREVTFSEEVRAIHEVPPEFVPTIETALAFYTPESQPLIAEAVERCLAEGRPFDLELEFITAKGRRLWVRGIGEAARDDAGVITGIHGAFQDISERKESQEELFRINRALKLLSLVNETLIRAEDEQALLDRICQIAVAHAGYRMAWVGYAEQDEFRTILPVAHAGFEEGYLREVNLSWSEDRPGGRGPAGRTIRSGKRMVCHDVRTEPNFSHFLERALRHGYRGMICLPLHDAERTFGLLGLYAADVITTSQAEFDLLEEMADDLAFGILTLRSRLSHKRVEAAVLKVAAGVSAATGTEFFQQLVRSMAEALGAQAAFVARLLPGPPLAARTIAAVIEGETVGDLDGPVVGRPSENLLTSESCLIPEGLAERYPEAAALIPRGAQGYAAHRLTASTGRRLGHLSILFRQPIAHAEFVASTLRIFATRAASEIERQEADARVREQAALLDTAHDAIYVEDLDGRILYWNKGAERTYGWSASEVMGKKSAEIFHLDTGALQAERALLLIHGEWQGEKVKRARHGGEVTVEVRWTLVRHANGEPKSVLAIDTDITARKQMEEQLFRAQRLDSIGTLASGLAHDLNNILMPITMCAPLLRNELPRERREDIVTAIEASAERGAQIIRQVLTFGRGAVGERLPLRMGDIIREIVHITSETFPKNIEIESFVAPDLFASVGDSTQWHQVLLNLSVNARDAMPEGGILRITAQNLSVDAHYASLTPGLLEGPHIVIEVSDTGSGIPQEVVERIFDPFFTTKPLGKGNGLGLSTALGIVKSHGGTINLANRPGRGSTFQIILPATAAPAQAAAGEPAMDLPFGRGETILIVDDEENVRKAARTVLEFHGCRTVVACNGIEAVSLYMRLPDDIDAVLADILMPGLDGIGLIGILRQIRPSLPVIATTGQPDDETAAKLKAMGVDIILKKPYTGELLLRSLDAALKGGMRQPYLLAPRGSE